MKTLLFSAALLLGGGSVIAQTKVTSATFGMLEARWLGPGTMSGRITDIKGVNNEPKTIYIGTAGGGVWKTTNAGASFKPIFDKYCQSIGALAIDQQNPRTLYVATGESNMRNSVSIGDGLYKSTDAGDNFTKIGLDSTEHISKVMLDPKNSNTIYVAAPGPLWSDSKHRGLYKSEDAGKTWNKILYISEKAGCADIAIDPTDSKIIYATTWEFRRKPYEFNSGGAGSGVYKSIDGGKNWRKIQSGLPTGIFGRVVLTLAPSSPKNLVAIVESEKTGLFISDDGGENWKSQSATMNVVSRPFYFSTLVIDPKDPKRIYRPGFVFSYSSDGGYSFADASNEGGWVHSDHHALWINPQNTNELWLGTDGGVYYSLDKGATWGFKGNLPVGQFYHVAVDNNQPYRIYGGLQDNGSWVSPSASPGGVSNANWKDIYGGDGFWTIPDATDNNIAYAESQGGNVARINLTNNKAVNIQPTKGAADEKLRWNWNTPLHNGLANPKNLYMGAQYIFKSNDKGRNWTRISPDLTTNDKAKQQQDKSGGLSADNTSAENHCTIFTITESPLDSNIIWAGTDDGNLQYTLDGGKNWTNVANNYKASGIPAQTWVSSIEPSRHDKNTVYATFDNHMYGDMKTYVGKSTDMGKTWTMWKSDEFSGFAHKIKEDPINKDMLFLGTEMGLFATLNGGIDWFRMKNNMPWYALVRDIQIQSATNDLVIATHGRGIVVVDDISPMRGMTKEVMEKDVVLFQNRPLVLRDGEFGGGGFPSTGGWNGGNPPAIQPIQFYLKERVMTGDVNVEILDKDGKLVQKIPGSKRKGINKIFWNLRKTPPKTAEGSTKVDYAGFTAPMVLPGDYTVKLKVGNKEYTQALKVENDAKGEMSLEDRKKQYDAAMVLYNMQEDLAKQVDSINKVQKLVKDNLEKIQNKGSKKLAQEYHDKLEELRSTLLATKQKSIFADEKQLREEISEVYMAVAGNETAPSNMQTERITTLKDELKKKEAGAKAIMDKYHAPMMKIFEKEKIYTGPKLPVSGAGI